MKKLAIYPLSYDVRELLIYSDLLLEYELCLAVTAGECDVGLKDIISNDQVMVTAEFDKVYEMCDTILFLDGRVEDDVYINHLRTSFRHGLEILVTRNVFCILNNEVKKEVRPLYQRSHTSISLIEDSYIKQINVPVVGVFGAGPYCDKFSFEVVMGNFFREKGHRVLQLGSKEIGSLYGMKKLPEFIYDITMTSTKRSLAFNQYLYQLCREERPDILIIGIPDAIMPVNHKILNDFGEIASIIANAVSFDIGILGLYYMEQMSEEYLDLHRNYCRFKLNCLVEDIIISKTTIQLDPNSNDRELSYYHQDKVADSRKIHFGDEELFAFSVHDSKALDRTLDRIYVALTSNIDVF